MNTEQTHPARTFRPRPSHGWIWLILMGIVILALGVAPALAVRLSSVNAVLTLVICAPIAVSFFALALCFPTMRYELSDDGLTLRYGPVLTYTIRPNDIRAIRRRSLALTIWSCIRFPGIALFTVPYSDVGNVKMCATSALNNILLIETPKGKYGITPRDEEELVAALRARMEA